MEQNLGLITSVTRRVSNMLLAHSKNDLMGWCAIGASMVAVRLLRSGVAAELRQGVSTFESHVWVQVGDVVADPTVGQFSCWAGESWWVGEPVPEVYFDMWDSVRTSVDLSCWPDCQHPFGSRGKLHLTERDRLLLGLPRYAGE